MNCQWCGAEVSDGDLHALWHQANNLHGPDCDWLRREIAQRSTGMFLHPAACSCGVRDSEETAP